jgi:hypothetical protein
MYSLRLRLRQMKSIRLRLNKGYSQVVYLV